MNSDSLKLKLMESLGKIYYMEAFSQLVDFLQGELYLLSFLASHRDKDFGPSQLSEALYVSRPRITATISPLREKGLVVSEADKDDRRRLKIRITEKGLDYVAQKQGHVEENFHAFIEGIGERDTLELIRIVNLAADIMEKKYKE